MNALTPAAVAEAWALMPFLVRDEKDNIVDRIPEPLREYNFDGEGYPLHSYHPKVLERKELFVTLAFTTILSLQTPAVAVGR